MTLREPYYDAHLSDETTSLYFDKGQAHSSAISDEVQRVILGANRIVFVSKMLPDGHLLDVLMGHSSNTYYYNSWRQYGLDFFSRLAALLDRKVRLPNAYHNMTQYLHAKYMIVERDRGREVAISGSHNFNSRGVRYGTEEIALVSTEKNIIEQLRSYTQLINHID